MKTLFNRVRQIFFNPAEAFHAIQSDFDEASQLITRFLLPLIAFPAVAMLLGLSLTGIDIPFSGVFRFNFWHALLVVLLNYGMILGGIWIISKWILFLCRFMQHNGSDSDALKLSVTIHVPLLAGGIFYLIPSLSLLVILIGLYGFYLLYTGFPVLMKTASQKPWLAVIISGLGILAVHIGITKVVGILMTLFGPELPKV